MSNTYRVMVRALFKYDLRDWATLFFTFVFPLGLLVALALGLRNTVPGVDLTGPITVNVLAFGAAFVGIYAGATHLALWRENGMFNVLRGFPLSTNTILGAQATVGTTFLLMQSLLLVVVSVFLGGRPVAMAPLALLPLVVGYLLFFFLGVLAGVVISTMSGVSMAASVIVTLLGVVGGAIMPVEALPHWMQVIAPYTPIYYMREAIAKPFLDLGTWNNVGLGILYLTGVALVLGFLAKSLMRFK